MAGSSKKEGTGGREVKMKSTKKKGRGRELDEDSDDERQSAQTSSGKAKTQDLPFMTIPEIEEVRDLLDCEGVCNIRPSRQPEKFSTVHYIFDPFLKSLIAYILS